MLMETSKFLYVKCMKCKNEQTIFSRPATLVKCLVCGEPLAIPTGGEADLKTKIVEVRK